MGDHNQDSDAAQSGRQKQGKADDGKLERTEAVPEHITPDAIHPLCAPAEAQETHSYSVRQHIERADTDRGDVGSEPTIELPLASPVPTSVTFYLRPVQTTSSPCFFCKEVGCNQVFVAKAAGSATKAYAVHNSCVLDHMQLQALASGGTRE